MHCHSYTSVPEEAFGNFQSTHLRIVRASRIVCSVVAPQCLMSTVNCASTPSSAVMTWLWSWLSTGWRKSRRHDPIALRPSSMLMKHRNALMVQTEMISKYLRPRQESGCLFWNTSHNICRRRMQDRRVGGQH